MIKTLSLLVVLALGAPQSPGDLKRALTHKSAEVLALSQQLPHAPAVTIVKTGADLQAALDAGGTIELPSGSAFSGSFVISKSNTRLVGNNGTLSAGNAPALLVKPNTTDVEVTDLTVTSAFSGGVVQCGDNGPTQTTVAQQPARITFRNVTIPTHRGKRGFEINCSATIVDSNVSDVWASSLADSQAIAVLNSCGPVSVLGGSFVAGSENIMVGGDSLKILDCPKRVAADLTFDGITLLKPEAWHTDGVNRGAKNLLELKAGKDVVVKNAKLSGSWKAAQDGWAIVITPKNSQFIENVLLDTVTVDRVGGCLQLLGNDYNTVTPQATKGLVVRNFTCTASKASYGGRGIFGLVLGGFLDATFENVQAQFDGNCIFQADTKPGMPLGPFVMTGSTMPTGQYAVMANGVNFGGPTPPAYAGREFVTQFTGNTFANAPKQFKAFYPSNTWTP